MECCRFGRCEAQHATNNTGKRRFLVLLGLPIAVLMICAAFSERTSTTSVVGHLSSRRLQLVEALHRRLPLVPYVPLPARPKPKPRQQPRGRPNKGPTAGPAVPILPPVNPPLHVAILDEMEPNARQAELNAQFQVVVKFQPVQQMRYPFLVKPYLDQGFEVVMVTEFLDDVLTTNLVEIGDGLYDDYLYQFIDELKDDGNRAVWIRPMHEFNGDWYPWGTYLAGTNTIDAFKRAWVHIHDVFTVKGANVKFQLAYNCQNGMMSDTPFLEWYPGAEYVDMIVCSGYNRAGSDENHMEWLTFQDVFADAYQQMAALPGLKPLGVGEMSCAEFEDYDKVQWIKDAFMDFETVFTRVRQVTWFLQNKEDGRWDLNTPEQIQAFGDCLREYTPQNQIQRLPPLPEQVDANNDGVINGDDAPPPPTPIDLNGDGIIDELDATAPAVAGLAAVGVDLNGDGVIQGPQELPGDFDYNGIVNGNDQLIAGLQGDFNGDGVIAGNEELPGDWNGNGIVGPLDVPPPPPGVDLNGDGYIGGNDELPGDWDGNGVVDVNDVAPPAALAVPVEVAPPPAEGDLNGDGVIAGNDELPGDWNGNGIVGPLDAAPPAPGVDLNGDGYIGGNDELPGDWDGNGVVDANDVAPPLAQGGNDWNGDGVINGPDELPGDNNWDGVVDAADAPPPPPAGGNDLNGDGVINGPDELPGDWDWSGVVDANDQPPVRL